MTPYGPSSTSGISQQRPPPGRAVWIALIGGFVVTAAGLVAALVLRGGGPATAAQADLTSAVVDITGTVPNGLVAGTGMIITPDGLVLTNNHVVAGTDTLVAQVAGTGRTYTVSVLGVDPTQDVAVLRLEGASGLPTVAIESAGVAVGDRVTTVGNAGGRGGPPTVGSGTVTGLDSTVQTSDESGALKETISGMIEFLGAIEPGDSGGPLYNALGRVVGMDTAASRDTSTPLGGRAGMAIPITTAMQVADDIRNGVVSPYIEAGHSVSLGAEVKDSAGVAGASVVRVASSSAAAAGINAGDVVISVAGQPIRSAADVRAALAGRTVGAAVDVAWTTAGVRHQATVTLVSGPPD